MGGRRVEHTTVDHRDQTEEYRPHADQKVGQKRVVYVHETPNFLEYVESMALDNVRCKTLG